MKLIILILILFGSLVSLKAQPSTEIYLLDLSKQGDSYQVSNPINISNNPGYDNQPYFLPDNSGLLFASNKNDQTDVVRYDIESAMLTQITFSEGSEFSPTVDPSGNFFTTIILEKDGTQLLWKYPINGGTATVIIPELKVGYHCWLNDQTIVSFVLGDPATLQVFDTKSLKSKVLDNNIGRSLHKIPNSNLISYISKGENTWTIKSMNPKNGQSKTITNTPGEVEDMAWSSDGIIFMGKGNKLYQYDTKTGKQWIEVTSVEPYSTGKISRISVSPQNNKIAIVVDK